MNLTKNPLFGKDVKSIPAHVVAASGQSVRVLSKLRLLPEDIVNRIQEAARRVGENSAGENTRTPPITTKRLAKCIGLEGDDVFRKKKTKWRILFDKYRSGNMAQIPLHELLPLVVRFYSRKGWRNSPTTESELLKMFR